MNAISRLSFGLGHKNPIPGSGAWNKREEEKRHPHEIQIPLHQYIDDEDRVEIHRTPSQTSHDKADYQMK